MSAHVWTDEQFDQMSWHDNHVHAIRIVEGEHGSGDLVLDIDHIVEWLDAPDRSFRFRILPAILTFQGVMFLRASLDYATPTMAFGPFSIYAIARRMESRERYVAQLWTISINYPVGEFTFEGTGFTQRASGEPILSDSQFLSAELRRRVALYIGTK
jgi:hypothetical protein